MTRLPLYLTLLSLLAGCAAGPNHRRPQTQVAAAFANRGTTNIAPNAAPVTWWRGFNDSTLDRLVNATLSTNQDLRIATARVREARALRTGKRLELLPIASANAGYLRKASSADSAPFPLTRDQRERELYNAGFDATWELDLFGRVRRSIEAGSAEVAAAEAQRHSVMVSLMAEVARNYFELRGTQQELEVARKNAGNQRETLGIIRARHNAGRGTDLDVARASAQLDSTLAILPPLEATIQRAIYRLSVLNGRPPTALEAELAPPSALPALPALVNIGKPADLLRRRPDIQAAEHALAAATARIGIETADLFPRLTFNGTIAFEAGELTGLGAAGSDTYAFGPRLSWAALDLGRVRARIKAAGARAEAALAQYEKTVLTALEETEAALVNFGRSQARRDHLAASARAAETAVRLASQRYESGIADYFTVLDAQRTQLAIQDQLAQSQTLTATALVAVYKALGGGWEIDPDAPAPSQ